MATDLCSRSTMAPPLGQATRPLAKVPKSGIEALCEIRLAEVPVGVKQSGRALDIEFAVQIIERRETNFHRGQSPSGAESGEPETVFRLHPVCRADIFP